jgi:hypothetical protein
MIWRRLVISSETSLAQLEIPTRDTHGWLAGGWKWVCVRKGADALSLLGERPPITGYWCIRGRQVRGYTG